MLAEKTCKEHDLTLNFETSQINAQHLTWIVPAKESRTTSPQIVSSVEEVT